MHSCIYQAWMVVFCDPEPIPVTVDWRNLFKGDKYIVDGNKML